MLPSLFNPSNDMALAANVRQYFPPQRIQQMESDLARLSRFWDEGPWGWSLATRQRYLRMGIPADQLPSDEWLAELRRLSSREFGVSYYDGICRTYKAYDTYGIIPCQARFYTSLDEVKLSIFNYKVSIIKSPWSSSGRGNIVVNDRPDDKTAARTFASRAASWWNPIMPTRPWTLLWSSGSRTDSAVFWAIVSFLPMKRVIMEATASRVRNSYSSASPCPTTFSEVSSNTIGASWPN